MSDDHSEHFIIPLRYYIITLVALLFLTFVTVFIAQFDFGALNIYVAMAVAIVKASFVITFFMGVKWDEGFNKVVLFSTFAFVGLFLAIILFDVLTRSDVYSNEGEAIKINSPVKVVEHYDNHNKH